MYAFAKLGRCGLGNKLWIWAKCRCWSLDHGVQMIAPDWACLNLRRLVRYPGDPRQYRDIFVSGDGIHGAKKWWILATHPKEKVSEPPDDQEVFLRDAKSQIVIFDRMGSFSPLIGRNEQVRFELAKIIKPAVQTSEIIGGGRIVMHVRMGDFAIVTDSGIIGERHDEDLKSWKPNHRIPIFWYIDVLEHLRGIAGEEIPATVFSDGRVDELLPLLQLRGVNLQPKGNALSDLLGLSRAPLLVASRSSYSLWAAYLGQMPVIYHPGARPWHEAVVRPTDECSYEYEWKVSLMRDAGFRHIVKTAIANTPRK